MVRDLFAFEFFVVLRTPREFMYIFRILNKGCVGLRDQFVQSERLFNEVR